VLRRRTPSKLFSCFIGLLHFNYVLWADLHPSRAAYVQEKQAKKEQAKAKKQQAKAEEKGTKAEEKATKEGVNGNLKAENGVDLAGQL
jgi:predicted RNA-binding protein YlxR (DUF448 family)